MIISRFNLSPIAMAAAVIAASVFSTVHSAHAQASSQKAPSPVNISAQPLAQALNELARQSGFQLLVQRELVEDRLAPAIEGRLTVQQALTRLLAGSGLEAAVDGNTIVIKRSLSVSAKESVLPAVTVTAAADTALAARQERGFRAKGTAVSGFREQEVLNTPFSTATISAEVIADQQAKSLAGVIKNDPSISLAGDPHWFERINVRGFYLSTDAVYRDGMSINDQGTIALENKAAVEVNKGLSALRYGATSPGGTLNYVVKRPTIEPLRTVTVSADGNGGFGGHADLGGRFGENAQFGYRINAAAEEMRSHVKPFKGDKQFLSGFFDWQVNDKLSFELDLEHQRMKKLSVGEPSLYMWGFNEDAAAVAAAQAAFSSLTPETYLAQSWAVEPNKQTYALARANYQFSDQWKASLAVHRSRLWRDQNSGGLWDVIDANGNYEASIYYSPNQARTNTAHQLVVQGDIRQGAARHEIAFGYDHVQRDMTYPEGVYESIGFDNLFNPVGLPRLSVGPAEAGPSYLANRTRQRSWFLTDNLIINDQWRVFGGLRHTSIEQYGAGSASDSLTKAYDKAKLNPTLGVIYKPTPKGTIYVSYAEGIEQGGVVNGANYTNNGVQLSPLTSRQIEAGIKWEVGRDTLLTAAVFQINKGLEIDQSNGDGTRTRIQDGRQVHRGIELTAGGQVSPNLRLLAGLAVLNAEVTRTSNTALVGKKPQGVPEWQANLYGDYALSALAPGLSINGGMYYGGKKAIDQGNLWFADSYLRLDAGIKYSHRLAAGQVATYRLTIDNLTDKVYLASTTWGSLQFGAPRTVRVSANYSF